MTSRPPKIYPCLAYNDPARAMAFLSSAFGFSQLLEVPGVDGTIIHAEMSYGPEVIMLGLAKPELGWVSPRDLPPLNATVCVTVPDVEAHYERANAAGATIVRPLRTTPYGAREYSATDPEGHQWHFGTYRPVADGSA